MAERTPPTAAIRQAWIGAHPFRATTTVEGREAEFDRWLAEVRREAAALTPTTLPSVEDLTRAMHAEVCCPCDPTGCDIEYVPEMRYARAVLALFEKGEGRG